MKRLARVNPCRISRISLKLFNNHFNLLVHHVPIVPPPLGPLLQVNTNHVVLMIINSSFSVLAEIQESTEEEDSKVYRALRELICFHTRVNFMEDVLGVGVIVKRLKYDLLFITVGNTINSILQEWCN